MSRRYVDVEEGDEIPPEERWLSKDDVRAYARVNGTYVARFTDDEGARKEGLPGMITPGNMTMGLITKFLERWAGIGNVRRLGTTFRGLLLPDTTVTIYAVVTEKHDDAGTAEVDVWVENGDGDRVAIGTATLALA